MFDTRTQQHIYYLDKPTNHSDDRHLLRHLPLPATLRPHFIITSENTPTILVGLVLLIPIFHF
jgi:hypothetical protein